AVVARRVLGVPGERGVARLAGRALVRAAVAEVCRRVADRAGLDRRVVPAEPARAVGARRTRQADVGAGGAPLRQEVGGQVDLRVERQRDAGGPLGAIAAPRDGGVEAVADRVDDARARVRHRCVRNRQRRPEQTRALMRAALRRVAVRADVPRRAHVAVVVVPAVEVTVRVRAAGETNLAPRAGARRADARPGAGERHGAAGAGGRRRAGPGGARAGADAAGLG